MAKPIKNMTLVFLDRGQTGHYSDSLPSSLEFQSGIMRQDKPGLT